MDNQSSSRVTSPSQRARPAHERLSGVCFYRNHINGHPSCQGGHIPMSHAKQATPILELGEANAASPYEAVHAPFHVGERNAPRECPNSRLGPGETASWGTESNSSWCDLAHPIGPLSGSCDALTSAPIPEHNACYGGKAGTGLQAALPLKQLLIRGKTVLGLQHSTTLMQRHITPL
eukprot:2578835-Amphidinium_carterae.1